MQGPWEAGAGSGRAPGGCCALLCLAEQPGGSVTQLPVPSARVAPGSQSRALHTLGRDLQASEKGKLTFQGCCWGWGFPSALWEGMVREFEMGILNATVCVQLCWEIGGFASALTAWEGVTQVCAHLSLPLWLQKVCPLPRGDGTMCTSPA